MKKKKIIKNYEKNNTKTEINNETLPTRLPPMEGQQKEKQYPG